MEFTILAIHAISVFNQAVRTCDSKSDSTDSDFLFFEKDNYLWVTSLNSIAEQTVLVPTVSLSAEKNEKFFVSGQSITELFRQFPDDEAVCTYEKGRLTVVSAEHQIKLEFPTTNADDFAPFNFVSESIVFESDAQKFIEAIDSTSFCTSTDASDGALTGVHVIMSGEKMLVEASDNNRVATREIEIDDIGIDTINFILSKEACSILSSLLRKVEILKIEKGKRHVRVSWTDSVLTLRLICDLDEDYPDLSEFINGDTVASIKLSKEEVSRGLKVVGVLVKDASISLKCSSAGLRISGDEKDRGAGNYLVEPQTVTGTGETMVPFKYLVQAIESMSSAWITLSFVDLAYDNLTHISITEESHNNFIFTAVPQNNE